MRLLLAVLALALPAAAQDAPADTVRLVPGHASLDTSHLVAGEAAYTVRLVAPLQQDIGTVTERTTLAGGVVTRVSRLSVPMQGLATTDSARATAATLAPLTHHRTGGPRALALEFSAEGVVGMRGAEPLVVPLDVPVFDAAWAAALVQSLPLAAGYRATMPVYDGDNGVTTAVVRVAGETPAAGAAEAAWTVEVQTGAQTSTLTVGKASRALLRTRFAPQPGVVVEIVPR